MYYYAIQVKTKKESLYISTFEKETVLEGVKLLFLQRRLNIRRGGINLKELQPLFPGYVFLQTGEKINDFLFERLKKTKGFMRVLPSNELMHPLNEHDAGIVKHFLVYGTVAESSKAYFDDNDRIVVTEGPLVGLEGNIISVDRRKRRVRLNIDFEGSNVKIDLSYDVIQKKIS